MNRLTAILTGPAARDPHKSKAAALHLWAMPLLASPLKMAVKRQLGILLLIFGLTLCVNTYAQKTVVRIGHFPNVTHAQALVGQADQWFEKRLSPDVDVEWQIFNAGSSVIEAMFANHVDIAYVGPNPAINGFVKSGGEAVRLVAGSASGGAALIVRVDGGILKPADFHGKKIASPQLGNTQDVSLRAWLKSNTLTLKDVGGDVQVVPLANADQFTLFLKKEVDAVWTVEPWVSMLLANANGKVFLSESSLWPDGRYATTVILVRKQFLDEHPELVKKFLETHVELTHWINQNPEKAREVLQRELRNETKKEFPASILAEAFKRVDFTTDAMEDSIKKQAQMAYEAGFLKKKPDLSSLFDLTLLKDILKTQKITNDG